MWRLLLITLLFVGSPTTTLAQEVVTDWQSCRGAIGTTGPVLSDCRPVEGAIDPQGRDLWLRSAITPQGKREASALYVMGVASSEAWLNGKRLGANGRPGASRSTETPGRYEAAFRIPEETWRSSGNEVVVHMSSFHGVVRLDGPISGVLVAPYPWPSRNLPLAVTFILAGGLFAAAFGFGVIHGLRRTSSSLMLAAMAVVSGLQAILESLRTLVPYAYPLHAWRLIGIWMLSAVFATLLVSYVTSRFWPAARRRVVAVAVVAICATYLASGFDLKTALALLVGLSLSVLSAAIAVYRRQPGSLLTLAYLLAFTAIGVAFPAWLADLTYFLFAASLILPLLMVEVVRLGRNDQSREIALTRAADRPNCLTVASSRGVELVPLSDIQAIVGADDYVEIRLSGGRTILHAARLDRLEDVLPAGFLRIHRSVIANLAHSRGFERDAGRGRLLMQEGPPLPISRNRLQSVRDALDPSLQRQGAEAAIPG